MQYCLLVSLTATQLSTTVKYDESWEQTSAEVLIETSLLSIY